MNDYRPDTPRAAFAFGAVGLMALTLGAFVVLPAKLDSGFAPEMTLAASKVDTAIEVEITPARIEVIGVRAPNVAWALPQSEPCRPQG
jgi:hypothetical protein